MPVRSEPALLEREAERDALVAGLADARDGTGALVVLEGAGGIGKTRLLREAREIGERMGLRVLAARATELEADYPFGVVRQLFEPVVAAAEADRRGALLAGAARPAAPVVGIDLGSGAPPLARDIADPSFATLNALYWLGSNLAEGQPLLLVVDDAHWADLASLRFLRFPAPRLEDLPVMLACATRPPEPDPAGALVAALAADPAARLIRPRPLTAPAVAEFVRAALAPGADDDFSASCGEVTGGNPFLLRELLAELAAEGVGGTREDAPRVREAAPAGISRAAALRLARAAAPARALAHALAVLGDAAEPRHVGVLAGLERDEVNAAADALAAAGIVEAARPLRFTHPIARTAIHGDLPAGERAAAHERAARMLAAEGAEPEQVAIHLLAADAAGDSALAQVLAAAGERAIERAAPEAAVRYLRRALAESPPPELRRRIVARLLVAGFRAADADALEGIDPMAELADDPAALVDAATPLSGWLLTMGRPGDVETVLLRAAATAAEHGDIEAAMLFESQRVTWLQHPPREAYDRLAPYADRVTPGPLGERPWPAGHCWWTSLALGGTAGEAGDLAWRAVASGEIFDELPSMPQGGQAILVLIRSDRFDAAEQAIERFADAARGRGAVPELAGAAYLRGELARARGDIATAAAQARAAVETARQGGFLSPVPLSPCPLVDPPSA